MDAGCWAVCEDACWMRGWQCWAQRAAVPPTCSSSLRLPPSLWIKTTEGSSHSLQKRQCHFLLCLRLHSLHYNCAVISLAPTLSVRAPKNGLFCFLVLCVFVKAQRSLKNLQPLTFPKQSANISWLISTREAGSVWRFLLYRWEPGWGSVRSLRHSREAHPCLGTVLEKQLVEKDDGCGGQSGGAGQVPGLRQDTRAAFLTGRPPASCPWGQAWTVSTGPDTWCVFSNMHVSEMQKGLETQIPGPSQARPDWGTRSSVRHIRLLFIHGFGSAWVYTVACHSYTLPPWADH